MGRMSAKRCRFFPAVSLLLTAGVCIPANGAGLTLQKVPPLTVAQASNYPQNVARFDLGAEIDGDMGAHGSAPTQLLSDDAESVYSLKAGSTGFLISLAKIENVDRISFLTTAANGTVRIATASAKLSPTSPQWHEVGPQELSSGLNTARIGPAEAKYVRLTFNARTPGYLSNLGVYSATAVSDFTMPRARKIAANSAADAVISHYNLADLHAKARTIFVSSGNDLKLANNMIDGQAATAYTFAADDTAPGAIIDLGQSVSVNRISIACTPDSPNLTAYVLPVLPGDDGGKLASALRIEPQMLATLKAVGTVAGNENGRVALNFKETTGRYILLAWAPPPATANANLSVAEVAVFGSSDNARLLAANTISSSDDKQVRDGKDTKDFSKEVPGEGPAEEQAPGEGPPPPLPKPPPFVFIPKVTPTSF